MRIGDPLFPQRLAQLLQSYGTMEAAAQELGVLGAVIAIPAGDVLERAATSRPRPPLIASPIAAAGADWTLVVPGGHIYVPRAVHGRLITAAPVATRDVRLAVYDPGGALLWMLSPPQTQAASLDYRYTWTQGGADRFDGVILAVCMTLPTFALAAGWTLQTISGLQAGDQWSLVRVTYEDYPI